MFHCHSRLAPQTEESRWSECTQCAATSTHKADLGTFSQISSIFFIFFACLFSSDGVWSLPDTSVALSLLAVSLVRHDGHAFPWLQGLCVYECPHVCVLYLLCYSYCLFVFFILFIYFSLDLSCCCDTWRLHWFVPPSPCWNSNCGGAETTGLCTPSVYRLLVCLFFPDVS